MGGAAEHNSQTPDCQLTGCVCVCVTGEASGPLAEIQFWRERSVDLDGIRKQVGPQSVYRHAARQQTACQHAAPSRQGLGRRSLTGTCAKGS